MADAPQAQGAGNAPDTINFSQVQMTVGNRAPNSKDQGFIWVYDQGSAVSLYVRSKKTGTWFLKA